jgi:hypothetical protein
VVFASFSGRANFTASRWHFCLRSTLRVDRGKCLSRKYAENCPVWVTMSHPCERLLADPRTIEEVQRRVKELRATLDPVRLLQKIRAAQQQLVDIADRPALGEAAKPTSPILEEFLSGLRTAWKEGEVRPTSVAKPKPKRLRRRPDPFAAVTLELRGWFEEEPWHTSRELLERLQARCPGVYPDGQLRTLQRRLKDWRREAAQRMVFGAMTADPGIVLGDGEGRLLSHGASG